MSDVFNVIDAMYMVLMNKIVWYNLNTDIPFMIVIFSTRFPAPSWQVYIPAWD